MEPSNSGIVTYFSNEVTLFLCPAFFFFLSLYQLSAECTFSFVLVPCIFFLFLFCVLDNKSSCLFYFILFFNSRIICITSIIIIVDIQLLYSTFLHTEERKR